MNTAWRTAALAAAISVVGVAGCGGRGNGQEVRAVKAVVHRWLAALGAGNGREVCGLLGRNILARESRGDLQTSKFIHRPVTCAEANSADPPGVSQEQLPEVTLARLQAWTHTRIGSVTVDGDHATVHYSWPVPKRPSPVLSYKPPAYGDRVEDIVTLENVGGRWKIG